MSDKIDVIDDFSGKMHIKFTPWTFGVVALICAVIMGGFVLMERFNNSDYERDVQHWKEKLGLIADSRAEDVRRFVADNFSELRTLADNPSLKLYMLELQMTPDSSIDNGGEASQKTYLRNLLLFTAQRTGFITSKATDAIPANIPSDNRSGIAVLGKDNKLLVGTQMSEAAMKNLLDRANEQEAGKESLIDLQKDDSGKLYMGFSVPIYSIQGEKNAESQVGKIVAIKEIGDNLFSLLKQAGTNENTLETLLIRVNAEKQTEYLSPLKDGSAPISKNEKHGAEETMSDGTIEFIANASDYRGNAVLATVRDIAGTSWKLISKIDTDEAFAESGAHRSSLMAIFTLIMTIIVMIIITMWWYSYSRHAFTASGYFKKLATKAQAQEKLLRIVADNQPESIYILDKDQKYWFANQQVADAAEMSPSSIIGKSVSDVRGAANAVQIEAQCDVALSGDKPIYSIRHVEDGDKKSVIRSAYIPLDEIPVASLPENTAGVLVVEQDVSEVFFERERRLSTQNQLVKTLVSLVDKRDPFAANHSSLVSQLSYFIALEMELDQITCETAKTAANLMNIGKIIVPRVLLTKNEQLTEAEKETIRSAMDDAADLMAKVPFDGPVSDTLKQWQEKWDGSGTLGLKGENILVTARIISVANAFIGMISPRSWRNAISVEDANKFLLAHTTDDFDQRVVVALIHFVENQNGREWIKNILDSQKKVA